MKIKTEFDSSLRGLRYTDDQQPMETDDYRAIESRSILALIFGIFSFFTIFSWWFAFIPLASLIVGWLALQKIFTTQKEITGFKLAVTGMTLAIVLGIVGMSWNYWSYHNLTPAGYQLVEFSDLAADPKTGKIPDEILALNGKYVFVPGFMSSLTPDMTGITEFPLVRTLQRSKFGSATPNPTEMVMVKMVNGQKLNYCVDEVKVGGILHVQKDYDYNNLPYQLDATIFRSKGF
ncbi:MAG: hypothetical protein LBQ54_04545 [Planctomycetaceae bacterium]|jgi:uncharacterized membrane protein (DUF485 family)|nr:hypothetical protein [Planctomycetaceae bacterium]